MDIINYPENEKPKRWTHLTLALGNFDGLHRGHMKLVEQVQRRSNENGMAAAVLYFDPHPSRIVRPDKAPRILMTNAQKLEEFSRLGIDLAAIVRFTTGLSHWKPEKFVQEILVAWLRVSEVWVGANFLFGHNRAGNFSLLRSLGIKHGFKVEKIDSVRYKDFVVSSTRVRRLVDEGRVDEAGALLGHHYYIDGEVVVGAGRGRIQGCPTANLSTKNEVVPTNGVYAATIMLDGAIRPAVTNIGVRPTFGSDGERVIEAHLLDYDGDLYGKTLRLAFVQKLRDEQAFSTSGALQQQIFADCERARALFDSISL